jgi:hypothetical protein
MRGIVQTLLNLVAIPCGCYLVFAAYYVAASLVDQLRGGRPLGVSNLVFSWLTVLCAQTWGFAAVWDALHPSPRQDGVKIHWALRLGEEVIVCGPLYLTIVVGFAATVWEQGSLMERQAFMLLAAIVSLSQLAIVEAINRELSNRELIGTAPVNDTVVGEAHSHQTAIQNLRGKPSASDAPTRIKASRIDDASL